jgi:hypothetical protein
MTIIAISFGESLFRFQQLLSLVTWRLTPLYIMFVRSTCDFLLRRRGNSHLVAVELWVSLSAQQFGSET